MKSKSTREVHIAHVQQVRHLTSNGPATIPHQCQVVTPWPALWTPVQHLVHYTQRVRGRNALPGLTNNQLSMTLTSSVCLHSLLVGESTVETLG